jgi:hypothetical protein
VILFESEAGTGFDLERITNERKRGDSRTAPAAGSDQADLALRRSALYRAFACFSVE